MSSQSEKPAHYYRQSAAIPFRIRSARAEILLITTPKKKRWIIPKGIIEEGMTAEESALNEAYEEAGVKGEIVSDVVAEYRYEKWGGECHVQVFLMQVTEQFTVWPESDMRERQWVPVEQAIKLVREAELKNAFDNFLKSSVLKSIQRKN